MLYKNLASVIILIVFVFFLKEYMLIPKNNAWDAVELYLNNNGKVGQQIIFCPGYLLNYAKESHMGKFNNFDSLTSPNKKTSIYETYWVLGNCKKKYYLEEKIFTGGINLYKMKFSDYIETNPFLTSLYKNGSVSIIKDDNEKNCLFKNNYFDCGNNYWEKIRVINAVAGGKKIKCLLTHPFNNAELKINYENLPSGRLIFGFIDIMANNEINKEDVYFKINNTDTVALDRNNRYKELVFWGGKLSLSVTTKNNFKKHVCFNLIADK